MKHTLKVLIASFLLLSFGLNAQKEADPFKGKLFAPEMIMENAEDIQLSKEQKKAIKGEIRAAQRSLSDMQWDLEDKMEALQEQLNTAVVDEDVSLGLLSELLAIENKIKLTQMKLLIRMKNELSNEQVKVLELIYQDH